MHHPNDQDAPRSEYVSLHGEIKYCTNSSLKASLFRGVINNRTDCIHRTQRAGLRASRQRMCFHNPRKNIVHAATS